MFLKLDWQIGCKLGLRPRMPSFVWQCICKACFSPQSPLSFQGSILSARRDSKGSVFSFRGRVHSENNYADDEQSMCEETGSRRNSLFLPSRSDPLYSTHSKSSLTPRILLPSNGKARYMVDSNGMVIVSGGASSPNSPSGILTPEVSRKRTTFDDTCVSTYDACAVAVVQCNNNFLFI